VKLITFGPVSIACLMGVLMTTLRWRPDAECSGGPKSPHRGLQYCDRFSRCSRRLSHHHESLNTIGWHFFQLVA
jgi:hypothetical protein